MKKFEKVQREIVEIVEVVEIEKDSWERQMSSENEDPEKQKISN